MNTKVLIAILISCAAALVVMLILIVSNGTEGTNEGSGVSQGSSEETGIPPIDSSIPPIDSNVPGDPDHVHGIDYDAAFAAFAPDTIMISSGEHTVTWAQFFVFLHGSIRSFGGMVQDFSDISPDGMPFAEIALSLAVEDSMAFLTFQYAADLVGATLDDEAYTALNDYIDSLIEMYEGEDGLRQALWEGAGFHSIDIFFDMLSTEYLLGYVMAELYGEDGELIPPEDLEEFIEPFDFLMVKHILRLHRDEGDDAPRREIEDILNQLDNYDGDDFEAFFSVLMFEESDDEGGLMRFPDGYLFQEGSMVDEFYEAALALEIGDYSGVVDTDHGYHIILRLPINYDTVPFEMAIMDDVRTVRQLAVAGAVESNLVAWREQLVLTFSPEFEEIDVISFATLFAWCVH